MLIERIKADFEYKDVRGTLTQLFHKGYSQVNVIVSKKGVIRGGHFHKLNSEAFYIVQGYCVVKASIEEKEQIEEFKAGDFFKIDPMIMHEFSFVEDTVLVSMYSMGVELENGLKDIYD